MPPRNRNAHHQSKSNRSIVNDHDVETDPEPERVDGPESAPSSPVSEIQASKPSQLTMQIAAQSATPMTAPGHVPAPSPPPPSRTAGHSRAPVLARYVAGSFNSLDAYLLPFKRTYGFPITHTYSAKLCAFLRAPFHSNPYISTVATGCLAPSVLWQFHSTANWRA